MRCLLWSSSIFYLVYAFSVCDTVSLLFGKGNIAVLKSIIVNPKKTGNIWHPPIEAFDEKSVKLMQLVYSEPTMSLGDQRYNAYRGANYERNFEAGEIASVKR